MKTISLKDLGVDICVDSRCNEQIRIRFQSSSSWWTCWLSLHRVLTSHAVTEGPPTVRSKLLAIAHCSSMWTCLCNRSRLLAVFCRGPHTLHVLSGWFLRREHAPFSPVLGLWPGAQAPPVTRSMKSYSSNRKLLCPMKGLALLQLSLPLSLCPTKTWRHPLIQQKNHGSTLFLQRKRLYISRH